MELVSPISMAALGVACVCGKRAVYRNGLQSTSGTGDGWVCTCGFTLIFLPQQREEREE